MKTWLSFFILTAIRTARIFSETSWFASQERCASDTDTDDCLGKYNEAIMDPIADFFILAAKVLIGVSFVLSLLCFKWRWLAGYFLYLECLIRLCVASFPSQNGQEYDEIYYLITFLISFVCFHSDSGCQIIAFSLTFAYCLFFGISVAYDRPLTFKTCLVYTFTTIGFSITTFVLGIIFKYIIDVRQNLRAANASHIKLLHGMHEGLLIVGHDACLNSNQWLFYNKPVSKLINTFLGKLDNNNPECDQDKRRLD